MRKIWTIVGLLGVATLTLGVAGLAFAQSETPPFMNSGYGPGMMGSRGRHGGGLINGEEGPLHELMLESFSEAIGIAVEKLEARIESGETMWQIAVSEGVSEEEISDFMQQGRKAMVEQAVEDGKLSQEQADFMGSRWQEGGFRGGYGSCTGYGFSNEEGSHRGPQGRWNAP